MILCLSWGAMICWLSLTPSPPEIRNPVLGWDKLQHGAAYAVLAFLALSAFAPPRSRPGSAVKVVFGVIMFGGLMELAQQLLTANRTADPLDFLANTVGALSATLLYRMPIFSSRIKEEQK